jgi:hypothetical protein
MGGRTFLSVFATGCLVLAATPKLLPAGKGGTDRADPTAQRDELLNRVKQNVRLRPEKVIALIGKPQRKSRQILYMRYRERWHYDPPLGLRVEFEFPRGAPSRLVSVLLLTKHEH